MFAVIFVIQPRKERFNDYLDLAKFLKPKLEAIDGFIDNERFESKRTKGRVLSLSTWRDEKSVVRWRTQGEHHGVQGKGRLEIFEDYHLRVGEITQDSDPPSGLAVDEKRFDATETGKGKVVTVTELMPKKDSAAGAKPDPLVAHLGIGSAADGLVDHEMFESIYNPGKLLLLATWRDADAADRWQPRRPEAVDSMRHRPVRVIRDYGMFDRREAPQYYPQVKPSRRVAAE
jgi:heme-degrading monooxygenase HmoA